LIFKRPSMIRGISVGNDGKGKPRKDGRRIIVGISNAIGQPVTDRLG